MKDMKRAQLIGLIFTLLVGTGLHFLYQLTGNHPAAGIFGAVNESTWEHLKMLFWPMLLFGAAEWFAYGKSYPNFILARTVSILAGMLTVIVLFYTYSGVLGKNIAVVDILIFVIGVTAAYCVSFCLLSSGKYASKKAVGVSVAVLLILMACFMVFTFRPPQIALFRDPDTLGYGIGSGD